MRIDAAECIGFLAHKMNREQFGVRRRGVMQAEVKGSTTGNSMEKYAQFIGQQALQKRIVTCLVLLSDGNKIFNIYRRNSRNRVITLE